MDSQTQHSKQHIQADNAKTAQSSLQSFLTRAGAGVLYAVLFIGSLFLGTYVTAVFIALMSVLCCMEFVNIARLDGKMPHKWLALCSAASFPLAAPFDPTWPLIPCALLILFLGLWYIRVPRVRLSDIAMTAFGPLYTGFMLSFIVLIRDYAPGFEIGLLTVGVCASLWLNDSFAYMVGSLFGKHKMVPKISPKKSWEGFFGGIVGSAVIWLILWGTGFYNLSLSLALLSSVLVATMGVIGDLVESRLKRGAGIKDSGNLIPGHGGMLDRSDSLLFGVPLAYFLLYFGGVL